MKYELDKYSVIECKHNTKIRAVMVGGLLQTQYIKQIYRITVQHYTF